MAATATPAPSLSHVRDRLSLRLSLLLLWLLQFAWTSSSEATDSWQNLPALETFASYEDMQRYFEQRNMRSMRFIDNPTADSYLAAFNQYNEQKKETPHPRSKREERKLPTEPRLLRFELADAVEPNPEIRQLQRQQRQRTSKTNSTSTTTTTTTTSTTKKPASRGSRGSSTTTPAPEATTTAKAKRSRNPRRQRRAAVQRQQPANFKVHMIPFEVTDAREPDAVTAQLIKRARALDQQQAQQPSEPTRLVRQAELEEQPADKEIPARAVTRSSQRPFQLRLRKSKRTKRAAPLQVLKFELADAKAAPMQVQRTGKQLATPTLLTMERQTQPTNHTEMQQHLQLGNSNSNTTALPRIDDNLVLPASAGESASSESKRVYIYKEAPATSSHVKVKKSLSALPHEVQKVITQLMKDGSHVGKAYVKYLPAKSYAYSLKPGSYIKYLPSKSASAAVAEPTAPVQVHIQPVPVVEQLRYVYKPAPSYAKLPLQPIVVQEASHPIEEVHHTYSAGLVVPPPPPAPPSTALTHAEITHAPFRASKPDPLVEVSEPAPTVSYVSSSYGSAHIKPIEHYQYELQQPSSPLIKIEYHAPADSLKEHYKQLPEFQELSTLIGKSPDDQIHGLTFLLAKEMQAKLQRQAKQLAVNAAAAVERPQDSKSPILFHPSQPQPQLRTPNLKAFTEHGSLGVQPGRLVGMAKTKQYVPIVETAHNDVKELPVLATAASKVPTPSSFIDFTPGHGLSHGYEGVKDELPLTPVAEHVVHHPTQLTAHQHAGLLATGDKATLQQYASKYAFGYRIRDFHTGNDFGHKQNRDLHGVTRGQYHILLPDGRIQNVIYHADDTGFHADVSFESGTTH